MGLGPFTMPKPALDLQILGASGRKMVHYSANYLQNRRKDD